MSHVIKTTNAIRSVITKSNRWIYTIELIKGNHVVSEGYLFTAGIADVRIYIEYQKVHEHSNHLNSICFAAYKDAVFKIQSKY